MSTYLQICQDVAEEVGIDDGGPSDVITQTGEHQRIVKWVKRAWMEIQGKHTSWRWMHREFTISTVADQATYAYTDANDVDDAAAISRFSHWMVSDNDEPPRSYLTSTGIGSETWLIYTPFIYYERVYDRGNQISGAPAHITVDRADNIRLGPAPSDVYTVTGYYVRGHQVLAADADTPDMPAQYHDLIMYRAMEKYARYHSAEEVLDRAEVEGRRVLHALEANQLPPFALAEPMV